MLAVLSEGLLTWEEGILWEARSSVEGAFLMASMYQESLVRNTLGRKRLPGFDLRQGLACKCLG